MLKRTLLIFLVLFVSAGFTSACAAEDGGLYKDAITAARKVMWHAIANGQGSGVSVAIMDRGEIVYAEGIGVSNREQNRAVDINTRFNIGSASKMFVAVAVLILADEKKISLDEKVFKYIPEFKMKDGRYKDITVRMLFNHSSGLPGTTFQFGYEPDRGMHDRLLAAMAGAYLKHRPGDMAIYCNDGFTLAEIIVEKVSGLKFLDFLKLRVFDPLGMKHTGASIGEAGSENSAEFYDPVTGKKHRRETVTVYSAGGLSSTASDLCRFGASFSPYGKKILSEGSLSEILSHHPTPFEGKLRGPQAVSEFGWDYSSIPSYGEKKVSVLAKSGGTLCYTSNLQIVPERGITIAYSISGNALNVEKLARPILNALAKSLKIAEPAAETVEKPVEPRSIPGELSCYEGFYVNAKDVIKVRFDMAGKKCDFIPAGGSETADGKEPVPLLSFVYNNGSFFCNENNMQIYFTTIGGEKYIIQHKIPYYETDDILYQELLRPGTPQKLKADIDGKTWLIRNASPSVVAHLAGRVLFKPTVTSFLCASLPGYIGFDGIKKIESPSYAGITATAFRDQAAVEFMDINSELWANSGGNLYSPADNAKKAADGINRIFIRKEGHNEWLAVKKGAVLSFKNPESGRIMVIKENAPLYDSAVNRETRIYAPEGSFIFCAGKPGDIFKIEVE